jgi:ABC-type multidrug transport system ATPase subunit
MQTDVEARGAEPRPLTQHGAVTVESVSRLFGAVQALAGVSLSVRAHEIVAVAGPSGCGKSTLLNMGSGLYLPSSGAVRVAGQPVTGPGPLCNQPAVETEANKGA